MKKHQPVLDQLFKVVNSYLPQPSEYYQYLADHMQPRYCDTDTILYKTGDTVKTAWFLSSGFGMGYLYDDSGDKQVIRLHTAGALIGGKSFIEQTPSEEYLVACKGSYWLSSTHEEVEEIYKLFPGVQEQSRLIMARREQGELEYKRLLALPATERVRIFYTLYPELSKPGKIIRDGDIASYLMIGQSTLRALRNKFKS